MALREDRKIEQDEVTYILNDVAAPGVVLCYKTAGSGVSEGDSAGVVQLAAVASGTRPVGVLLQNFVNIDETLYHVNWHKNEQQINSPCWFVKKGWVITDKVTGTPTLGAKAYLTNNGIVTPTVDASGGTSATPYVGEFGSVKDEAGFIKLIVNLPQDTK